MNFFSSKSQTSLEAASKSKIRHQKSSSGSLSASLSSRTISSPVPLDPSESDSKNKSSVIGNNTELQYNDNAKLRMTRSASSAFSLHSVSQLPVEPNTINSATTITPSSSKKLTSKMFSFRSSAKSTTKKLKNRSSVYLENTKSLLSEGTLRHDSSTNLSTLSPSDSFNPIIELTTIQSEASSQLDQVNNKDNSSEDTTITYNSDNEPYRIFPEFSPNTSTLTSIIDVENTTVVTVPDTIENNDAMAIISTPTITIDSTLNSTSKLNDNSLIEGQDLENISYTHAQRASDASTQTTNSSESIFTSASKFSSLNSLASASLSISGSSATSICSFSTFNDKDGLGYMGAASEETLKNVTEIENRYEEVDSEVNPPIEKISAENITTVLAPILSPSPTPDKPIFDASVHCYISQALPGVLWVGDMCTQDGSQDINENIYDDDNDKYDQYFDNNYLTVFLDDDDDAI